MSRRPVWVDANGQPTLYVIDAAIHAATVLDLRGSRHVNAIASYWNHAIGASFSPADLRVGERLLVDCDLVVEEDQSLYPSEALSGLLNGTLEEARTVILTLALRMLGQSLGTGIDWSFVKSAVPDAGRREEMLIALARHADDEYRVAVGESGEKIVLEQVRNELIDLGYDDLARAARRVSLLSALLGYDISAPRVTGANRFFEVKATTKEVTRDIAIHVTRNEVETGSKLRDWFLVVCKVETIEPPCGHILGWCTIEELNDFLPHDVPAGLWELAFITLPINRLTPGLPRP